MSILVACQKCKKSFKVSDKFAGKSGPCPNCKATIQIPSKKEEVQVHAPTEFATGGRSKEGKLITKPIARENAKLQPVTLTIAAAAALVVLIVAWVGGELFHNTVAAGVALLLVGTPLSVGGYIFVRDVDLEPYRGIQLCVRAAVCAAVYAALWGAYAYVAQTMLSGELWEWMFVVPGFLALGAFVPQLAFDVTYGDGFLHYGFYVLVTALLGFVAGMGWPWEVPTPLT